MMDFLGLFAHIHMSEPAFLYFIVLIEESFR